MTLPSFVGAVSADGGATLGNTYTTDFTSLSLQDGDYLLWVVVVEVAGATLTTPPTGWTQRYAPVTSGSRTTIVYDKTWHTGDAKTLSYVKSTANADGNTISAWRAETPASRIYGTGKTRAGAPADTGLQTTALGITTTAPDTKAILIGIEATSAAETSPFNTGPTMPSGWTQDYYKPQGTTIQTIVIAHKDMPTAGATGNATLTYQNTQASNAWAVQIGLVGVTASNVAPAAGFTHSESGLTATFTDASTDSDGTIASRSWNFGDSSTSTATNPSHTYAAPGTYTVTLTVTDNGGATNSTSQSVTVAWPTATIKRKIGGLAKTALVWKKSAGTKKAQTRVMRVQPGVGTPTALIAKSGFVVGHMGQSWDTVEGSGDSLVRAMANGVDALMISVSRTSDGVWFLLNDTKYLDRMSLGVDEASGGTTLDSTAMTWAQVSARDQGSYWTKLGTSSPRRPYLKLVDFLAAHPAFGPILIDPKTVSSAFYGELLNIMDANGGPNRFIAKYYITGAGWRQAAKARNAAYKTWGYGYGANIAGSENWAVNAPNWDWLGLDIGTSQANWTTALSYGKPVIGHIASTKTMYDTGMAKGASGIMTSGVQSVRGYA